MVTPSPLVHAGGSRAGSPRAASCRAHRERLVHQQQLRLVDQRAGQRDALLLAAGQLAGPPLGEAVELHQAQGIERRVASTSALARRRTREREGHVLGDAHVREQGVALEHHADVALVRRQAGHRAAVEQDLAAGRVLEAGDHVERRGLARAGGAEEGQELALAHVERHVMDGGEVAIALVQVGQPDGGKGDVHFHRVLLRPLRGAVNPSRPSGSAMPAPAAWRPRR